MWYPIRMDLWIDLSMVATSDLAEVAIAAESSGLTGVSVSDHLVIPETVSSRYPYSGDGRIDWAGSAPWPDSWVAISAMATVTTTLRFMTGVYVAPLREPVSLARAVATASVIANDRLACGFGAGWMQEEFAVVGGEFTNRGGRLDEIIEILRKLWTGETVGHSGEFYQFAPVRMIPAPARRIAIWCGGNSGPAMRRAVANDGWIGAFQDASQATADLNAALQMRSASADAEDAFHTAAVGPITGAEDIRRLSEAGYHAAVVPLAIMRSKGRSWTDAVEAAASLRPD